MNRFDNDWSVPLLVESQNILSRFGSLLSLCCDPLAFATSL